MEGGRNEVYIIIHFVLDYKQVIFIISFMNFTLCLHTMKIYQIQYQSLNISISGWKQRVLLVEELL